MGQTAGTKQRVAFITNGENRVFPLITELFQSVKQVGFADRVTFCVVDHGLTSIQSEALKAQGVSIHTPSPDAPIKSHQRSGFPLEQGAVSKAFLRNYFPGHEIYAFFDCRTWLQSSAALELFIEGAERGALSIVSTVSRFRARTAPMEWIGAGLVRLRSPLYRTAKRARLGRENIRQLSNRPLLNADVFALSKDAPHWDSIQHWVRESLKHAPVHEIDDLAVSACVHLDGLRVERLPEWCNYQGPWRLDNSATELVEYNLPHTSISVVNFRSYPDMAVDASVTLPMLDTEDHVHHKSLRAVNWSDRVIRKEPASEASQREKTQPSKLVS